jgi:tetratricopeptide (TPR) repeat protein
MDADTSVEGLLQKAYEKLKASDPATALTALDEALKIDFEQAEVTYALKCLNWWLEKIKRLEGFSDAYDEGVFLLSQWKAYYAFLDRVGVAYDRCQYAIRCFVFAMALRSFERLLVDGVNEDDPALLLQVGRCYKGAGNYEWAQKYLEQAVRFKRDGEALSELADVKALLAETRTAKALFREAFSVDPQGIDLHTLESELIVRLIERVKGMGYTGPELAEWIPIYGALFEVFSVKRDLKPVELARLKQEIWQLENDIRGRPDNLALLTPRLINRYLWLINHYENEREREQTDARESSRAKELMRQIEETLLKIKIIDPRVYERFMN